MNAKLLTVMVMGTALMENVTACAVIKESSARKVSCPAVYVNVTTKLNFPITSR